MKEEILEYIENPKYQAKDLHELAEIFNATESEAFRQFVRALNELEDEAKIARNSKDHYISAKAAGIITGKLSINPKGFGFVDSDEMESGVYVSRDDMLDAMNGDMVAAKVEQLKNGDKQCVILKVLQRNTTHLVGTFSTKRGLRCYVEDERFQSSIKVTNRDDFEIEDGAKALLKITRYGNPTIVQIEKMLGNKNDPGMDILSILYQYNIDGIFPAEVLEQVETIPQEVQQIQKLGRKDLTGRCIVTIDGDDSKDFDDAISIERVNDGFRLGVHIADVSYYVPEGSPLDLEARKRGTSVYVVDRVVPMLPFELSNGICSLNPHVVRLTLTCDMMINREGEVTDYQLYQSYIKSAERMTYNNVNRILDGDPTLMMKYRRLGDLFTDMAECSALIRARRKKLGAIDFDSKEAVIKVDEQGKVLDVQPRKTGYAEGMIEDFMVCANECVARHMKWTETPSLYRVHTQPEKKKLQELVHVALILGYKFKGAIEDIRPGQIQEMLDYFREADCYPALSMLALRSMQKARYDAQCLGHYGLALEEYTHFTSPIRRYPDLVVHRMLRKYVFEGCSDPETLANDEKNVVEIAQETSFSERVAVDAERAVEDTKKAEFMVSKIGNVYTGVISGVTKFGFFVELANSIEGLVHVSTLNDDYYNYDPVNYAMIGERTGKIYKLGQQVKIKVIDADKEKRNIDFKLVTSRKRV